MKKNIEVVLASSHLNGKDAAAYHSFLDQCLSIFVQLLTGYSIPLLLHLSIPICIPTTQCSTPPPSMHPPSIPSPLSTSLSSVSLSISSCLTSATFLHSPLHQFLYLSLQMFIPISPSILPSTNPSLLSFLCYPLPTSAHPSFSLCVFASLCPCIHFSLHSHPFLYISSFPVSIIPTSLPAIRPFSHQPIASSHR